MPRKSRLSAALAALVHDFNTEGPRLLTESSRLVSLSQSAGEPAPMVKVYVRCRENAALDGIPGVHLHQAFGKVRTAQVPLSQVQAFADQTGITRVAAARKLKPLDLASVKVKLPEFRLLNPGRTGAGVVIGIVDTGIDSNHPAFAGRIHSIWDQTIAGKGFGSTKYGNVLTGPAMAASLDTDGHGTHVAGIAAGATAPFVGVAPGATIVIVKTDFENTSIGDGVRYIFDVATKLGLPAVVNLSLGGHGDAHDGSDDLSANINALSGPGRIVVAAAGNEGHDPIHGTISVPAGKTVELPFQTVPSTSQGAPPWVVLNGWYPGAKPLEVAVRTSAGDVTPFQAVAAAGASPATSHTFASARLTITTPPANVNMNNDHQFLVQITPGGTNAAVQGGIWRLRLKNPGTSAIKVDVWSLVDGRSKTAAFLAPGESDSLKVGSPGSAASVVTVAAFTTRNTWTDSGGVSRTVGLTLNDIADFSSPGPLRNNARKPDVTAPGAMLVSCLSAASAPDLSSVVAPGFLVEAGTSMASPFIAGLVALMLQQTPTLTPAQVKARLKSRARIPGKPAGSFSPKWGFGLVDAKTL